VLVAPMLPEHAALVTEERVVRGMRARGVTG
jgi:hypothetical protein